MNNTALNFLTFRRMLTPLIIQIVFWIAVGIVVLWSLIGLAVSVPLVFDGDTLGVGFLGILAALVQLVLFPLFLRIYAELIIIFFRMNETLTEIRHNTSALPSPHSMS